MRDAHGMLLDSNQEHVRRDAYRIHRIIDVPIARFTIDAPRSFTLFFEPGESPTIYDDNEKYDSFSINFEGTLGIYV